VPCFSVGSRTHRHRAFLQLLYRLFFDYKMRFPPLALLPESDGFVRRRLQPILLLATEASEQPTYRTSSGEPHPIVFLTSVPSSFQDFMTQFSVVVHRSIRGLSPVTLSPVLKVKGTLFPSTTQSFRASRPYVYPTSLEISNAPTSRLFTLGLPVSVECWRAPSAFPKDYPDLFFPLSNNMA